LANYFLQHRDQVTGRTDHDLSPSHLADQYVQDDKRVLAGEPVENRIELVGRFDHTALWCQTTKRCLLDSKGSVIGTLGITRPARDSALERSLPESALAHVLLHMRQHFSEQLTNPTLAAICGRSVRAFERLFSHSMGMPPQQYLRRLRIRLAAQALLQKSDTMMQIALSHGFYDQSHFVREFRRETGLTPRRYQALYWRSESVITTPSISQSLPRSA
jgi:AraC-like DNA-binding protein